MNYDKYDTICCKYFYFFICNKLICIDHGNQLLMMTNTMNITILQPSNFNVFLHDYFFSLYTKFYGILYEEFVSTYINPF